MPLGSSSASPVVRPGPSAPQARRAIVLMDAISTSPYGSSVRACLQRQPARVEGCASRYKVPHFSGEAHDVAVSALIPLAAEALKLGADRPLAHSASGSTRSVLGAGPRISSLIASTISPTEPATWLGPSVSSLALTSACASFYPTLGASPEPVTIMLKGGRRRLPAGKRAYPSRPRRTGLGQAAQKLLPAKSAAPYVFAQSRRRDDAQGVSRHDQRQACSTAAATNMAKCSRDCGSIFRQENFEMVVADPLSLAGFTTSTTILERSDLG